MSEQDTKTKKTPEPRYKVRLTDEIVQAGVLRKAGEDVELRRDQVGSLAGRIRDEDVKRVLGATAGAGRGEKKKAAA